MSMIITIKHKDNTIDILVNCEQTLWHIISSLQDMKLMSIDADFFFIKSLNQKKVISVFFTLEQAAIQAGDLLTIV